MLFVDRSSHLMLFLTCLSPSTFQSDSFVYLLVFFHFMLLPTSSSLISLLQRSSAFELPVVVQMEWRWSRMWSCRPLPCLPLEQIVSHLLLSNRLTRLLYVFSIDLFFWNYFSKVYFNHPPRIVAILSLTVGSNTNNANMFVGIVRFAT